MHGNESRNPEGSDNTPPRARQDRFNGEAAEAVSSNAAGLKDHISSGIQEAIAETGIGPAAFEDHKEDIISRVMSAVFELPGVLDGTANGEKVRVVAAQAAARYIADNISESTHET